MGLVPRLLEGGDVVVEEPVEARILGVSEVDDDVDVAVEEVGPEDVAGPVGEALVGHLRRGIDALEVEARERRGGGESVEAVVVVADLEPHTSFASAPPARPRAPGSGGSGRR